MSLSPDQLDRYKRHILLKEIGGPGVRKLRAAHVSMVGAGALGGPCALYLAAAGIGAIDIWDDDRVDRSNLQRQVQFRDDEIGSLKAKCLADRLSALNPDVVVTARSERFDAASEAAGHILIDATDNFETRFILNQHAHATRRYLVSGAASRWTGQIGVFASGVVADAPCYQCFVPQIPPEAEACDEVGVVGALTGMVGTQMALETIKLVASAGTPLIGKLSIIDGLGGETRTVKLRPNPDCPVCGG